MKKIGILIAVVLASSPVFASTIPFTPFLSLGGGITSTFNLGKSTNFPITNPDDEFYNYSVARQGQTTDLFETFFGVAYPLCGPWLVQVGAAYSQTGTFQPKGGLTQGADVQSQDNYNYQFDLKTRQLMLQTKLMHLVYGRFYPYLLLGLGGAINTASNFTTTVPPSLTFTRVYRDKTSTSFAFRVGLGIDVDLDEHLSLGIGYRLTDLGGYSLGKATIDQSEVSGTLSQSTIYANEVLAQLTYYF